MQNSLRSSHTDNSLTASWTNVLKKIYDITSAHGEKENRKWAISKDRTEQSRTKRTQVGMGLERENTTATRVVRSIRPLEFLHFEIDLKDGKRRGVLNCISVGCLSKRFGNYTDHLALFSIHHDNLGTASFSVQLF